MCPSTTSRNSASEPIGIPSSWRSLSTPAYTTASLTAGENIARVTNAPDPASHAHSLLMKNPGHRGNILGESYRRLGVGVAVEGRTVWITQLFVQPRK